MYYAGDVRKYDVCEKAVQAVLGNFGKLNICASITAFDVSPSMQSEKLGSNLLQACSVEWSGRQFPVSHVWHVDERVQGSCGY